MNNNPFPPGAFVVAYVRDSGGDTQELSVSQQQAAIVKFCQDNGLVLARTFTDAARPGSSVIARDGFLAMMDHFRHNATEAGLVIWSYSRFARSADDSAFFRADLRRRGYILHSLNDSVPDGNIGRIFEAIIEWKDEQFLLDLSRDVRRGLSSLVATYGAVPGLPPVGFLRQPIEIGKRRDGVAHVVHRWDPDPALAPTVRQAFEMRAGAVPLQDIHAAVHLYRSINCYSTFFPNQLYKGTLVYGGVEYPEYCPAIVDPATWQAAQNKRRQVHPRRIASRYLLSGLLFCARCGAPMSGMTRSGHLAYACTRHHPHHQCDLQPVPAKPLEQAIITALVDHILSADTLATQRELYLSSLDDRQAELTARRAHLRKQQASLSKQIARITDAIASAGSSQALLDKLRRLELEMGSIQGALYDLERSALPPPDELPDLVASAERLKAALLEGDDAKQIIRGLVQRIIVDREGRRISGMIHAFFRPITVCMVSVPVGAPLYTHSFEGMVRKWEKRK